MSGKIVFNIYFFEQQHKIIRLYELFVLLFNNIFVFPIFKIGDFRIVKIDALKYAFAY
jgi:hypothetical protein